MDYSVIERLVGSVGFPIVVSFVLLYYIAVTEKKHSAELQSLNSAISILSSKFSELTKLLSDRREK